MLDVGCWVFGARCGCLVRSLSAKCEKIGAGFTQQSIAKLEERKNGRK
jgi:hypothetical protein